MSDLIDRQMVIDAIEEMQMPIMRSEWSSDQYKFSALAEVREKILQLPSAQPEIKCVAQIKMSMEDLDELVAEKVDEIKHAQLEPHWIPCNERLPEELEEVNVTWVNHDPEPYYNFVKDKPFTATAVYYKEKWYWYSSVCADILAEYGKNDTDEIDGAIEITAWMPLPKPYGGESE